MSSSRGRSSGEREEKMEAIKNMEHRRIVFSKYKREIFKKAAELSMLCGADAAILLFSPQGNTVYPFGTPCVNSIINRFIRENPRVDDLRRRREIRESEKQLKAEKERAGKGLEVAGRRRENYINGLGWDELQQLKGKLEGLKRDVQARLVIEELQKKDDDDDDDDDASFSSSMSDSNGPPAEETDDDDEVADHISHSP